MSAAEFYRSTTVRAEPPRGLDLIELPATFSYKTTDPLAIEVTFWRGDHSCVEWRISRDLLTNGMHSRVGHGDVRINPHPVWTTAVQLHLSSPSGRATFVIDSVWLDNFLDVTFQIVRAGSEYAGFDVDAAWAEELAA